MKDIFNDITIYITVKDRTEFFEGALFSALKQTVKCPIKVIDNASETNYFENLCIKNGVDYQRNTIDLGYVGNMNACIYDCKTKWMTILHDDDLLYPNFIEYFLNHLESGGGDFSAFAVGVDIGEIPPRYIASDGINQKFIVNRAYFLENSLSPFPGVIFNAQDARNIKGFDIHKSPISDIYFWYGLYQTNKVYKTSRNLAFYRIGKAQGSMTVAQAVIDKCYTFRTGIAITEHEARLAIKSVDQLADFYEGNFSIKLKKWDLLKRELVCMIKRIKSIIRL